MPRKRREQSAEGESKHDKFTRLATQRMPIIIKRLRQLANLAGPGYEYTSEEKDYILSVLTDEVKRVKDRFEGTRDTSATFQLPSGSAT